MTKIGTPAITFYNSPHTGSAITMSSERGYFYKANICLPVRFSVVWFKVGLTAAGYLADVAIYSEDGSSRLYNVTGIDCSSDGIASAALAGSLSPGSYWFALAPSAMFRTYGQTRDAAPVQIQGYADGAYPLPAAVPALTAMSTVPSINFY